MSFSHSTSSSSSSVDYGMIAETEINTAFLNLIPSTIKADTDAADNVKTAMRIFLGKGFPSGFLNEQLCKLLCATAAIAPQIAMHVYHLQQEGLWLPPVHRYFFRNSENVCSLHTLINGFKNAHLDLQLIFRLPSLSRVIPNVLQLIKEDNLTHFTLNNIIDYATDFFHTTSRSVVKPVIQIKPEFLEPIPAGTPEIDRMYISMAMGVFCSDPFPNDFLDGRYRLRSLLIQEPEAGVEIAKKISQLYREKFWTDKLEDYFFQNITRFRSLNTLIMGFEEANLAAANSGNEARPVDDWQQIRYTNIGLIFALPNIFPSLSLDSIVNETLALIAAKRLTQSTLTDLIHAHIHSHVRNVSMGEPELKTPIDEQVATKEKSFYNLFTYFCKPSSVGKKESELKESHLLSPSSSSSSSNSSSSLSSSSSSSSSSTSLSSRRM